MTTSPYGQSGQNGSVEYSSLLQRLRNDKQLQDQVSRTMNSMGVVEGDTDRDQDQELQEQASSNGKHIKKKLGLLEKSQDNAIKIVVWLHLRLGVRYSTVRNIDFDKHDLWLFMAGELEVVTSRDIMCAAGFYEWSAVKRLCSNSNRGGDGH